MGTAVEEVVSHVVVLKALGVGWFWHQSNTRLIGAEGHAMSQPDLAEGGPGALGRSLSEGQVGSRTLFGSAEEIAPAKQFMREHRSHYHPVIKQTS